VKAISINPVDVKTRAGKGMYGRLKDLPLIIPGWDVSGEVVATASNLFKTGDEVFGMVNFPGHGKAYAEFVAASATQLARKPANMSHAEAAASTLVALTAWQGLVVNANVMSRQQILVHAAAGGVGHIAVQLAKHLGAVVTGTSSGKNREFVLGLGADHHIDYNANEWPKHTGKFDFVFDTVGGQNFELSIDLARKGGTVISIVTAVNDAVKAKAEAAGVNSNFFLVQSNGEHMSQIARLLEQKIIKPHISHTFPFDQMKEAHTQVETGRTVGKVVVLI
jgi:NADPH:quinone reductase-like Zn-dependent oxidoreductase